MKSIMLICLTSLLTTCIGISQSSKWKSPVFFQQRSAQYVKYDKQEQISQKEQEIYWSKEGIKTGEALAEQAKVAKGFRTIIDENVIKVMMQSDQRSLAWPYFDRKDQKIEQQVIRDHFFWYGWRIGFEKGFIQGAEQAIFEYDTALDLVYDEEGVDYPDVDLPFTLNYDKMADELCSTSKDGGIISKEAFEKLFTTFSLQIIKYLNRNLGANNKMDHYEQQFALSSIFNLAPEMACQLYPAFEKEYEARKRLLEAPFYDYSCYLASSLFLELANEYMGGISDAILTISKGNPEFATTTNFNVMGRISELLIKKVLPVFQEGIYSNTLIYDYNQNLDGLTTSTKNILVNLTVETRKKTVGTKGKIRVSNDYKIKAKEKVLTIVDLGLTVDDLLVKVNHEKQEFNIYISKKPRLVDVVYEDYKLMKESNVLKCDCTWDDYREKREYTDTGTLSETDMKDIMKKKIQRNVKDRPICQQQFQNKINKQFIPVLKKIFEPAISLPHSCYKVVLHFGNDKEVIISSKCNS